MNEEVPEKIRKFMEKMLSDHRFKDLENIENKTIYELIPTLARASLPFFESNEGIAALLEFQKYIILNSEKTLIGSHLVDEELYKAIKDNVEKALKKNPVEVKRIYLAYKTSLKSKYPIDSLTESLLFYQVKVLSDLNRLAGQTTLLDLRAKIYPLLVKILEESGEEEFSRYIFDWILKFGYLIEGFVIDILRAELKFQDLLNDRKYSEKKVLNLRFSDLLKKLGGSNIYQKYRNAIFHTKFLLKYDIDFKARKIIFPTIKGDRGELTIQDLIGYYFQLIQAVQTHRYAYTYSVPLDMREDGQKQLIEMLDLAIKSLEILEPKGSNNP